MLPDLLEGVNVWGQNPGEKCPMGAKVFLPGNGHVLRLVMAKSAYFPEAKVQKRTLSKVHVVLSVINQTPCLE